MNATDREMMVRDYDSASNEAQNTFEHSIIKLQDAAYNMGLERGKLNANKAIRAIEQTIQAIDATMIGTGDELERINLLEDAYAELETLLKELSA